MQTKTGSTFPFKTLYSNRVQIDDRAPREKQKTIHKLKGKRIWNEIPEGTAHSTTIPLDLRVSLLQDFQQIIQSNISKEK